MFTTKNNLPSSTRSDVAVILDGVLASLTDLYSQTKQAHWNVRGRSFFSLHKLFDELAGQVEAHIDPLAERIVALGGIAHGTVRQSAAASSLPEFPTEQPDEFSYVFALTDRFAGAGATVRAGIDATSTLGDADSADLLTAISRALDQGLWFLEAHTRS